MQQRNNHIPVGFGVIAVGFAVTLVGFGVVDVGRGVVPVFFCVFLCFWFWLVGLKYEGTGMNSLHTCGTRCCRSWFWSGLRWFGCGSCLLIVLFLNVLYE